MVFIAEAGLSLQAVAVVTHRPSLLQVDQSWLYTCPLLTPEWRDGPSGIDHVGAFGLDNGGDGEVRGVMGWRSRHHQRGWRRRRGRGRRRSNSPELKVGLAVFGAFDPVA